MTLSEFGALVASMRKQRHLSQDELAAALRPPISRTAVALLEQGRRVQPQSLQLLADFLQIPEAVWVQFADPEAQARFEFESSLREMTGAPASLDGHDSFAASTANRLVSQLFSGATDQQGLDTINALLVLYNIKPCSQMFFSEFLGADAFTSVGDFAEAVLDYQKKAIRLFSTFADAFDCLNGPDLNEYLKTLAPRDLSLYRNRAEFEEIEPIEEAQLPMLGYISATTLERRRQEREFVSEQLRKLAALVRKEGFASAINQFSDKTKRKIDSLLRQLDSSIQNGLFSPLFPREPEVLMREAEALAPVAQRDIDAKKRTEQVAEMNLSRYLAADHLDLYMATSMRTDADFISVNRFADQLSRHAEVRPLKLRYFNPTQSWIEDRVAKGLVEALMLRRAQFAIYMAQKSDSFGKDSEASVALGQGKSVVVYVPKLCVPELQIDSEEFGRRSRQELFALLQKAGDKVIDELDQTIDHEALHAQLLTVRLAGATDEVVAGIVNSHWADFDLYGEDDRIKDPATKSQYRGWLDAVVKQTEIPPLGDDVKRELLGILISRAVRFEARAALFRESHPLALQVIHTTGVINGMLVVRSVDACAKVLKGLVANELEYDLEIDDENYRLIERSSRSTVRVISRHLLIRNAFSRYFERGRKLPMS